MPPVQVDKDIVSTETGNLEEGTRLSHVRFPKSAGLGQKPTFAPQQIASALPPVATEKAENYEFAGGREAHAVNGPTTAQVLATARPQAPCVHP
jgi:hypothetical protein